MNSRAVTVSWTGPLLFVLIHLLYSCGPCRPTIPITAVAGRPLSAIFSGGAFVGAFPINSQWYIPSHGTADVPLPVRLVPSQFYVFHFPATGDKEGSPLATLPKRLRSEGFRVKVLDVSGDRSDGIRIFEITFDRGTCSGNVKRISCEELIPDIGILGKWSCKRRWEPIDTVLVVTDDCPF